MPIITGLHIIHCFFLNQLPQMFFNPFHSDFYPLITCILVCPMEAFGSVQKQIQNLASLRFCNPQDLIFQNRLYSDGDLGTRILKSISKIAQQFQISISKSVITREFLNRGRFLSYRIALNFLCIFQILDVVFNELPQNL